MPFKIVGESNLGPKYATLSKGFPAWVQAVDKMPKSSAIIGGLGVFSAMSFFVWAVMGARGKHHSLTYLLYNTHLSITYFPIVSLFTIIVYSLLKLNSHLFSYLYFTINQ